MRRLKLLLLSFFVFLSLCGQENFRIDATSVQVGQTYTTWSIIFELGGTNVIEEGYGKLTLDSIYDLLKNNSSISIELGYHYNNLSGSKANLSFSQKRAEGLKKYFVRRGIDSLRIQARGYGSNQPLINEDKIFDEEFKKTNGCHVPAYRGTIRVTIKILKN